MSHVCAFQAGLALAEAAPNHAPPVALDRERNRVLVAEALQRAAMVANNGNLEAACMLLAETEAMLSAAPSTRARDPVGGRLLDVVQVHE